MSEACGFKGSDIMFSSNDTPAQDMKKAYDLGRLHQPRRSDPCGVSGKGRRRA